MGHNDLILRRLDLFYLRIRSVFHFSREIFPEPRFSDRATRRFSRNSGDIPCLGPQFSFFHFSGTFPTPRCSRISRKWHFSGFLDLARGHFRVFRLESAISRKYVNFPVFGVPGNVHFCKFPAVSPPFSALLAHMAEKAISLRELGPFPGVPFSDFGLGPDRFFNKFL